MNTYLGIDIGSVSLSYVLINEDKKIVDSGYLFHKGNIQTLLKEVLQKIDLSKVRQIAYNNKSAEFFKAGVSVNEQVALIEGVQFLTDNVGSVFTIGGETFGLILFDEQEHYKKFISNSSCAAGTGAFLDQQASRLGLASSAELSQLAQSFEGEPPKIATRCAVFAKTDLIHCQQQGYSIAAISAGLCKGLAQNIADTLVKGVRLQRPVVVVGGVSKNKKVIQYLSEIIDAPVQIPEQSVLAGAIGCALVALMKSKTIPLTHPYSVDNIIKKQAQAKHYFFPPLTSKLSAFPDFSDHTHYVSHDVEIDLYDLPRDQQKVPVFMGIDIGSTSTKAIIMEATEKEEHILLGLYTRTMGQPIKATQALLRVLREIEQQYNVQFDFRGVGTTGSGRKFIQKVINADMAIDEITAHARAAYALNPKVDTIIEIGGQDAKFTVLKDGQVTFSVMNYVCAAGTGSFIEEQAKRLNVPLSEYAKYAVGTPSPLSSDRCTVFMERDLNHFMSQGYSQKELLAAVLHSVRDNYLSKVAHLNKIGNVICFQGATAKNHALVMAFEQKLGKPIFVSRYCHLTGALGVCILMQEQMIQQQRTSAEVLQQVSASAAQELPVSNFRGIDFYKESPQVIDEICDGCKNHCKLKRINLEGESIVWGYLCGRDESDNGRKSLNNSGFDLLSSRRRVFNFSNIEKQKQTDISKSFIDTIKQLDFDLSLDKLKQIDFDFSLERLKQLDFDFSFDKIDISFDKLKQSLGFNLLNLRHKLFTITQEEIEISREKNEITIGIPNALYMVEYIPFWRFFFKKLGYSVVVSSPKDEFLERGKEIAGAEFCAPISNWHGHVQALADRADYLFLPHMFVDRGEEDESKFYCYYSNYAVALVQNIESLNLKDRCIAPIIDFSRPAIDNIRKVYESLPAELKLIQTPSDIQEAYTDAWRWFVTQKRRLVEIFQQQRELSSDVSVVLLGRPYLILDRAMNKNIPQKFSELGVKTFYQDMLPLDNYELEQPTKELFDWNHWKFGANILQAAEYIAKNPGLYPVILTAFKCSPDSFVLTYFKEIMDAYQKPYLILQIDEHGSDVGYETRIEAAIRSFRNHLQQKKEVSPRKHKQSVLLSFDKEGTILIPNYDSISCSLICAAFEHAGYKARLIEETPTTVLSSLRLNDGQCLPISTITQGAAETVKKHNLKPENTAIFLNTITRLACNFPQYPLMAKKLLQQKGNGFEKIQVYASDFDMTGFPLEVIFDVYSSYLLGGLLRRIGCKIRPYELITGQTDRLLEESRKRLYQCISQGESKEAVFREIVAEFAQIPVNDQYGTRPKVSIIGDLYVRDNDVFNQQLIYELEQYGAEVVTTPFTYILRILAMRHNQLLWADGRYLRLLRDKLLVEFLEKFEKRFYQIANEVLQEDFPGFDSAIFDNLKKYNLSIIHGGETAQNILKVFSLLKHYPDLVLLIHVNPIFCCPALVSESLFKKVEKDIGIPIVSITYDGTTTKRNEILIPYLHYITKHIPGEEKEVATL